MRLFFAIEVPESSILDKLYRDLGGIDSNVKATDPMKQHITLKFIGDPGCSIENVIGSIGQMNLTLEHFEMKISRGGAFPNWRRPSVAWIGFEAGEAISNMVKELDEMLNNSIGSPLEKRGFNAHLTVARFRGHVRIGPIRKMVEDAAEMMKADGYSIPVNGFDLISSTLTPEGPIHEKIRSFQFEE